ncbi:MAG TPA: RecX family transcriptional regulator [Firmicutes bacterium]|nr:RecX family transcriptional regulator [Bacillota bacterium]
MPEYITVIAAKKVKGGVISLKTDIDEYLYDELKTLLPHADDRRIGSEDEYRRIYLSPAVAEKYQLRPGVRIEYAELIEIIEASNFARAKSKALSLLTGRDYSTGGLIKKLSETYPKAAAEAACSEMVRLGFIKEEDYGRRLAEEYICRRGMSKRQAVMKLRDKGFDAGLAESLADSVEYNPTESINKILSSKYGELPTDAAGRRKMYDMLYRKGFSSAEISAAIDEFLYDE